MTFYFQFENTNCRIEHFVDRVVCVKSRRLRQIASFASNRVVNHADRVVCVKSRRQIASLDRAANRVVGSRRKSRRWIASLDRAANRVVKSRRWIASLDRVVNRVARSRRWTALNASLYRPCSFCSAVQPFFVRSGRFLPF